MKLSCVGAILAVSTPWGSPVGTIAAVVKGSVKSGTSHRQRIVPKLDPESHEVFWKGDYPHDRSPERVPGDWIPSVQDSGEYDNDYVKDENDDDFDWKHQVEYYAKYKQLKGGREEQEEAEARLRKIAQKNAAAEEYAERELEKRKRDYEVAKEQYENAKKMVSSQSKVIQVQDDDFTRIMSKMMKYKMDIRKAEREAKKCRERVEKSKEALRNFKENMRKNEDEVNDDKDDLDDAQRKYDAAKKSLEEAQREVEKSEEKLREIKGEEEKALAEASETTTTTKFSLIPGSGAAPAASWRWLAVLATAVVAAEMAYA